MFPTVGKNGFPHNGQRDVNFWVVSIDFGQHLARPFMLLHVLHEIFCLHLPSGRVLVSLVTSNRASQYIDGSFAQTHQFIYTIYFSSWSNHFGVINVDWHTAAAGTDLSRPPKHISNDIHDEQALASCV